MSETGMVNKINKRSPATALLLVLLVITISVSIRWVLVLLNKVPFNSDEAIVGLMARHILGGEHPIFFYGQSYMGSLDAYFVAGSFLLFGKTVAAIRITQSFLLICFLFLSYQFANRLFNSRKAALLTIVLLGTGPVNFLLYTTVTLGGYLESLIIGVSLLDILLIIKGILLREKLNRGHLCVYSLILGFFIGLGIWVLGITLVFSLTVLVLLTVSILRHQVPKGNIFEMILLMVCGGIIGTAPIWAYIVNHGAGILLKELSGSAIAVAQPYLNQVGMHLVNLLLFGISTILGLRPPWEVKWLLLPLIPFSLGAWGIIIWKTSKYLRNDKNHLWMYIWLPSIFLIAAFILTSFGIDPSGRYFLPVHFSLALTAGLWIMFPGHPKGVIKWALPVFILIFNLGGIVQGAIQSNDGITTQFAPGTSIDHTYDKELISFLKETSNTRGYSTYWAAYSLAFQSDETVILVPALPYHADLSFTTRDNRYDPYAFEVEKAENPIYITANNPNLDIQIVNEFNLLGVGWTEKNIGDYHVYYALSRKVLPQEIGFGINRP